MFQVKVTLRFFCYRMFGLFTDGAFRNSNSAINGIKRACYIGSFVGGKEQVYVCHFFRRTPSSQRRGRDNHFFIFSFHWPFTFPCPRGVYWPRTNTICAYTILCLFYSN